MLTKRVVFAGSASVERERERERESKSRERSDAERSQRSKTRQISTLFTVMVRTITTQSPKDKRKSSTPHKSSKPSSEVIYSSPKRPGSRASTSTESDAHTKSKFIC